MLFEENMPDGKQNMLPRPAWLNSALSNSTEVVTDASLLLDRRREVHGAEAPYTLPAAAAGPVVCRDTRFGTPQGEAYVLLEYSEHDAYVHEEHIPNNR